MKQWDPRTAGAAQAASAGDGFGAEEGRVLDVTAKGARFTLPSAPGYAWGPAPWPLGPADTPAAALTAEQAPRPGDRCLVVFAGADHTPWVIGWWR